MSLVTVIIPMHNDQRTIAAALGSVLAQSISHWQIVVADDGSTDESHAIVAEIARRDSRVGLVRQSNQGAAAARNLGLRYAMGRTSISWMPMTGSCPGGSSCWCRRRSG
ncbi:MAG: glycosyltransferase family 2 protein, partial [Phycisphaerales bacterium]|nr:glycosyltransferase family 2 protein [Phycisphaerales bacterium]